MCFHKHVRMEVCSQLADVQTFKEVSTLGLQEAGMDLRKWRGNEMEASSDTADIGKVLDIVWDSRKDDLRIATASVQPDGDEWTRRMLLKCVASLCDPLGLMVPITITGKILIQQAWRESGD